MAATTAGGQDRVLATAQHIVKSLRTTQDVTDDMLYILSNFDNRLSNISDLIATGAELGKPWEGPEIERFESAEKVIVRYEPSRFVDHSWENSPDESCEFLAAIDVILVLMGDSAFQDNPAAIVRAEGAVQMAMEKLEDMLRSALERNTVLIEPDRLFGSIRKVSLSFSCVEIVEEEEIVDNLKKIEAVDDDSGDGGENKGGCFHEKGESVASDISVELINPCVIPDLRDIVERMTRAGYEKECCQVYSSVRMEILIEFLETLGVPGKLSIEEVQRMEWSELDDMMKKWARAVKVVAGALLDAEKRLCEQIFDGYGPIKEVCFVESAKACVFHVLNVGETVAEVRWSPEKLFRILDMYDALKEALPLIQGFFSDKSGIYVRGETQGILDALGEAVMETLDEFESAVKGEASKRPTQGGDIHPLVRYVMNYVKLLVDYSETLNLLLEPDNNNDNDGQDNQGLSGSSDDNSKEMSPLGRRLLSLMNSLESNLEEKAKSYEDAALQPIFLLNNKFYIMQKVKFSDLCKLLGDDWMKRRRGLLKKYSMNYLRASWGKVLSHLSFEGLGGSSSSSQLKLHLKDRFKNFNASFEELHRVQSSWKVVDPQLRTELRILISERVIPAYSAFLGRYGRHLEGTKHAGRYIKYTAEDLDGYLVDLFEGTPYFLQNMRRKGT